jgi:hypothetical protein
MAELVVQQEKVVTRGEDARKMEWGVRNASCSLDDDGSKETVTTGGEHAEEQYVVVSVGRTRRTRGGKCQTSS